jgi:hypothetical protein
MRPQESFDKLINREAECHFRLYRASIREKSFAKRVAQRQQDRRPTNVIHWSSHDGLT